MTSALSLLSGVLIFLMAGLSIWLWYVGAITTGANDFMLKPFQRVTLDAKVAGLTARKREPADDVDYINKPLRTTLAASIR